MMRNSNFHHYYLDVTSECNIDSAQAHKHTKLMPTILLSGIRLSQERWRSLVQFTH